MDRLKRKLRYAWDDITEYWGVRVARFSSKALFWSLAFLTALVILPFSPKKRKWIVAKASNAVGRLFWELHELNRFGAIREWLPPMRNLVRAEVRDCHGKLKWCDYGFNLRTDTGRSHQAHRMGNSSPPSSATNEASWISVHEAVGYTPAVGDTIATWETNEAPAASGFGRFQGVFAHTELSDTYTLEFDSYTASTTITIYGAALINEDDSPNERLFVTKNFAASASMVASDTLKITWSITI
jgi:hypothetical protein